MYWITLIIGLAGLAVTLALAGRRVQFLYKTAMVGQPTRSGRCRSSGSPRRPSRARPSRSSASASC
ncbi:hypothetical protein [Actinomadura sp. CNU-125]|uniref:hypothetical protein n=1 Tax=Actinomadura sp. CNU-125 TaxID=1904961 RepID=UPI0039670C26